MQLLGQGDHRFGDGLGIAAAADLGDQAKARAIDIKPAFCCIKSGLLKSAITSDGNRRHTDRVDDGRLPMGLVIERF